MNPSISRAATLMMIIVFGSAFVVASASGGTLETTPYPIHDIGE